MTSVIPADEGEQQSCRLPFARQVPSSSVNSSAPQRLALLPFPAHGKISHVAFTVTEGPRRLETALGQPEATEFQKQKPLHSYQVGFLQKTQISTFPSFLDGEAIFYFSFSKTFFSLLLHFNLAFLLN